ncbi:LINE-1 reverse transcriptase homolog, partial [Linum perenne]
CLIPKKEDVEDIKDLRPISLVGCIYKVISKVLMERLKVGISEVISENQCAFIGGRQILDASLIVNEVIDSRKRSGRAGLVFKLDIEKAYDHVNWGCLIQTLEAMNFPPRWVDWMWSCISSPFFSVLVNGESKGYFKSERGLRQGDSLSPFLFTCVMEVLSGMFRVVRGAGLFSGFFMDEANRRGEVSHVLYADDTIVFCEADEQQVKVLLATLVCFETVSGLRVNYHKSCMFPVGEVANALRFADLFGCGIGSFPSTYLGLPLGAYAKSKALWDPVVSCVTKRLSSWKARLMSFGGRLTLVKSVLSCLPIYYMSLFKAPTSVIKQIERMQCRFLWEGVSEVRKLHLVRWDLVKAPLARGGLGILDLSCMNSALLNKWSWRFGTERVAWWRRLVTLKCREDKSSWVANWNMLSSGWSVWRWIVLECAWFWKFGHIDPGGGSRWIIPLQGTLRGGAERERVALLEMLDALPQLSEGPPSMIWSLEESGVFSVRSLAKELILRKFQGCNSFPSEMVWVRHVPTKVAGFVWQVAHGKVSTIDNLIRKGMMIPNRCVMCGADAETIQHLFRECSFASQVWSAFSSRLSMFGPFPLETKDWLWAWKGLNCRSDFRPCVKQLIHGFLWGLWGERNSRVFRDLTTTPQQVIFRIAFMVGQW